MKNLLRAATLAAMLGMGSSAHAMLSSSALKGEAGSYAMYKTGYLLAPMPAKPMPAASPSLKDALAFVIDGKCTDGDELTGNDEPTGGG